RRARPELLALAREAGLDAAVVPEDAVGIPLATTVAEGRRRAAQQVRRLAETAAETRVAADQADDQAARSERELADRQHEADGADRAWVRISGAWRHEVRSWSDAAFGGEGPDWAPLHRILGSGGLAVEEVEEVRSVIETLLVPWRTEARQAEAAARSAEEQAGRDLAEVEAERAALESIEEAVPPSTRFRGAARDGRTGSPFYELVDVDGTLSPADRAGLEAALEASGLLDAWVADDGVVLHPSTQDVIVRADAPALPAGVPSLAEVLVTTRPDVARALRTVGWGPQTTGPWVAADGRWSLGSLRGAWTKEQSEYLGAATRRATRERQLADLSRRCAERAAAVADAAARRQEVERRRDRLDGLMATMPTDTGVRAAASSATARAEVAGEARTRHESDRRSAEQARTTAVHAAHEVTHAASSENLPAAVDALDAVVAVVGQLTRALGAWATAWAESEERRSELAEAGARRAAQEHTAEEARRQADTRRREHQEEEASLAALEEAVGATVAEVLDAIALWTRRRDAAHQDYPAAADRARELATAEGRAAEAATTATADVERAVVVVGAESARLDGAAGLPGVGPAAVGEEWQ
ncbi:MAG: hypothetical protein ACRDY1_15335, partial [Acidimicrobiales bacterium]